jgi:hypothetical protein
MEFLLASGGTTLTKTRPVLATIAILWIAAPGATSGGDPAQEVLALERQAMDGWLKGNPEPQLAISDPEITYIHAVTPKRVEGLAALRELFEPYRGRPLFDAYEIRDPKVQVSGDVAVLTYELAQRIGSATTYWNGTQVYCKKPEGWRVIHTHWSAAGLAQR